LGPPLDSATNRESHAVAVLPSLGRCPPAPDLGSAPQRAAGASGSRGVRKSHGGDYERSRRPQINHDRVAALPGCRSGLVLLADQLLQSRPVRCQQLCDPRRGDIGDNDLAYVLGDTREKTSVEQRGCGGPDWDRTSDLPRVKREAERLPSSPANASTR